LRKRGEKRKGEKKLLYTNSIKSLLPNRSIKFYSFLFPSLSFSSSAELHQ
jgi:hypothetical protein